MAPDRRGSRLRILVAGAIATPPGHGGMAWAVLQYVLGLQRLGHEVTFVEPMRRADLVPAGASLPKSENAAYLERVARSHGFPASWAALVVGTRETAGLSYGSLETVARQSDLVVNLSGLLTDPDLLGLAPARVYVDLDEARS